MAAKQNRDDQGKFPPGVSGNPKGRPRTIPKFVAAFRRMEPAAMRLVKRIIEGKTKATPREQLEAVKLAMAYARGKPRETVELTGKGGAPLFAAREVIPGDPARTAEVLEHLAGVGAVPPAPPADTP